MEFQIPIDLRPLQTGIKYPDKIMLLGSCFTEHIGDRLSSLKFPALQNPNGILFDPYSVADSLNSYMENRTYEKKDLFLLNELWQSWRHHSRFSGKNADEVLTRINDSQRKAHQFLKETNWLIITLGSSFSYHLTETDQPVANCHRAPAQQFRKHLMPIADITGLFIDCLSRLQNFNPGIRVIFTVSPVRHIRDGAVENNRSKARLLEAVHTIVEKFENSSYFPAYELVIDVLRDYRFYDIDLVHPNYMATKYVMEKFVETCMDKSVQSVIEEVQKIVTARKHRAFQPDTQAHRQFLMSHFEKTKELKKNFPFLDLAEELEYFSRT